MMRRLPLLLVLLAALASAGAAAQAPAYDSLTVVSAALGEARHVNVYTPPGYSASAEPRYPVLYMPDGGTQEDFGHVSAALDAAIRAGEARSMLLVGVENTERRRDMTGPTTVDSDREIAPRVGGSASFRAFFRDELMPEIGRRYRVSDESAIVGESLAGLFIVEAFFEEPGLFGTSVALSPSLWWNGEALVQGAGAWLQAHPDVQARLYVSSASDDVPAEAGRLADALGAHAPEGLDWTYEPRPDLTHATIYRGSWPQVLRSLFPPQAVPTSR